MLIVNYIEITKCLNSASGDNLCSSADCISVELHILSLLWIIQTRSEILWNAIRCTAHNSSTIKKINNSDGKFVKFSDIGLERGLLFFCRSEVYQSHGYWFMVDFWRVIGVYLRALLFVIVFMVGFYQAQPMHWGSYEPLMFCSIFLFTQGIFLFLNYFR